MAGLHCSAAQQRDMPCCLLLPAAVLNCCTHAPPITAACVRLFPTPTHHPPEYSSRVKVQGTTKKASSAFPSAAALARSRSRSCVTAAAGKKGPCASHSVSHTTSLTASSGLVRNRCCLCRRLQAHKQASTQHKAARQQNKPEQGSHQALPLRCWNACACSCAAHRCRCR